MFLQFFIVRFFVLSIFKHCLVVLSKYVSLEEEHNKQVPLLVHA